MESLTHIFVYGTLKRGQCREHCWPVRPVVTQAAWTHGCLYDLGEYPAMVPGEERVAGQLWSFQKGDLPTILEALDRVEGTNQPGQTNEYDRIEIQVTLRDSIQMVPALTYIYARRKLLEQCGRRVENSVQVAGMPYVIWPIGCSWDWT